MRAECKGGKHDFLVVVAGNKKIDLCDLCGDSINRFGVLVARTQEGGLLLGRWRNRLGN